MRSRVHGEEFPWQEPRRRARSAPTVPRSGRRDGDRQDAPAKAAPAPARAEKYVYSFGGGRPTASAEMKNLLGGKGANLAEMAGLGLPVPPGFTITTDVCTYYYANRRTYPAVLKQQVDGRTSRESRRSSAGSSAIATKPLLVSVRSGARASMPGMMDTVLNLGLNDETVQGLIARLAATSASPGTRTAASCRCTATSCSA